MWIAEWKRGRLLGGRMKLTHFDKSGRAKMVDVSAKMPTTRTALAEGQFLYAAEHEAVRYVDIIDGAFDAQIAEILKTVRHLREKTQVPLLFMTCYNPIYRYGSDRFARHAAQGEALHLGARVERRSRAITVRKRRPCVDLLFATCFGAQGLGCVFAAPVGGNDVVRPGKLECDAPTDAAARHIACAAARKALAAFHIA